MKFRLLQSIFGLFLLVFLVGCNDQLISNFKLVSDTNTMNTRQVATAVDAQGWKHTLWSECFSPPEKEHCRLVYARYNVSAPAQAGLKYLVPFSLDASYVDPDIAVTDAGVAYGVWKMVDTTTSTTYYSNCWQNLSTGSTCDVFVSNQTNNAAALGAPRVAARGNTVYAVYEEKNGTGTRLFFRQLLPLDQTKGPISSANSTVFNSNADLAISPDGTLHVVWKGEQIYYADNYTPNGQMVPKMNLAAPISSSPKIVMDEGGEGKASAYITFADRSLFSNVLKIYSFSYYSGGSMVQAAVNLSANQPWNIYRDPDIAAAGSEATSRVYGAFTAANAATSGVTQIFKFNYSKNEGTASPVTTMLTSLPNYPNQKSNPQVVIIHDDLNGTATTEPVIAWRSSQVGTVFDVYLYNQLSLIRKIFTTRAGALMQGENSFDLAGNGKTAGGVWIDERGPSDPRLVPWVSMNGSQVFIPMLQKGQTYQNDPQ